ncbi:MAG: hypothetical protein FWF52_03685 [Candidatus Azobacteroides sp.]|nr:hypothetical protein [Candidatus Azobacteroides sp.]
MKKNLAEGWHVVYTKVRHEKKVHEELINQKYHSYLPAIRYTAKWSDRQKITEKLLFPSYVIVKESEIEQ